VEIPAELVALSGTAIAAFLGLSMLFALLRRPHKTFHRYFAHLALYAAVVHGVLVLLSDPEALRALNAEEISGLTAMGGLIVTMMSAAGRAPRRHRAATTAARTRSARAWRTRHPLAARLLHWLPGICTVAALTVHVILVQDSTFHRWLWIIVCEGVALVMIGRYVIPHPLRLRRRGKPRHQITPETPTAQIEHATKVIHQTAPLILRPEKRVVNYRKIGITTPDQIPTCLTYSPHTLLVALRDKTALLTYRRELALCGGRAKYLRSMDDLRRALPASPEDREISEYVVCGDPVFLTDVHEFLAHAGVPHNRIRTETSPSHIDLPADHPSARIGSIKEHVFRR
jgi:hypothetical protein